MQHRVVIGRALVRVPPLVLGDDYEPTGNLDRHKCDDVLALLRAQRPDPIAGGRVGAARRHAEG